MPNFFSVLWDKLEILFSSIGKILWPLIEQLLEDEGQLLIEAAKGAVETVYQDPGYAAMSWQDRLSKAVGIVTDKMSTEGKDVATTAVINAIQAVYTDFKAQQLTP